MTTVDVRSTPSAWTKRVYVPIGVLMLAIAIVGFWPTYFSHLVNGSLDKVPIIHVHAAVFSGWLVLVIIQATLAGRGRIQQHRKIGKVGMAYGVLLILIGWLTALTQFATRVKAGDLQVAESRLFAPLTDMLFFAPVLAAAWAYRRKPEIHKRLIVVATTILLIAAVHRITFLGGPPPPAPFLFGIWLLPIAIGMGHDFLTRRLVHPVYIVGILLVVLMKQRGPLHDTAAWKGFVAWLATLVTGP